MSHQSNKERRAVLPPARTPPSDTYDVAIIGAGPAGAAMSIALARAGWRVVAVDRATFPREKPCAEYLSPAAEPLLAELGALEEVLAGEHARLRGFRIFAPGGSVIQGDFAAGNDHPTSPRAPTDTEASPSEQRGAEGERASLPEPFTTGLAVSRWYLDAALVRAAVRAGAEVREGWRLADLSRDHGVWRLRRAQPGREHGDGDGAISARLLVAADGVHSLVARRLGLAREGVLRRVALVAHVRGITGLSQYGEMHVAGGRYVGLARLSSAPGEDIANVALVVDEQRDGRDLAGRANTFLRDALVGFPGLRDRVRGVRVVRDALAVGRLDCTATRSSGDGLLLVGDAAGYYDPFTGEGIYRALRGASLAAPVANEALRTDDLSAAHLAPYSEALRKDLRGRHLIEQVIQFAVRVPPLLDRAARALGERKAMADTLVGVTGDYLPPSAVLRPGYILRLVL